ncbi:MAG: exodeoxyribonuclease VII large subunit [Chlamydia sp.]
MSFEEIFHHMNPLESEIVLSVSEINSAIKSHIEPIFRNITIRGEVSNLKIQPSGHMYFSLVDKESLIQAVLFRSYVPKSTESLKNGDEVLARGEISIYAPRGNYQLVVRDIRQYGKGLELARLQLLKKRLQDLGWFNLERKKTIPIEWKTIGVITSPSGAVIQDVVSVLERRTDHSFHLILNPVRVQGELAAQEIAMAIKEMNRHKLADLIIVCRGGGSSDDLAAFNSEEVARACFESHIPIISAVGHETDTTIIDLVADIRAPTPSIAAEIASQKKVDTLKTLKSYKKAFASAYAPARLHEFYEQRLDELSHRLLDHPSRLVHIRLVQLQMKWGHLQSLNPVVAIYNDIKRLKEFSYRITKSITVKQNLFQASLNSLQTLLFTTAERIFQQREQMFKNRKFEDILRVRLITTFQRIKERFQAVQKSHALLNPKNPLEKGYALIFREKETQVIDSIDKVDLGDSITILLRDGAIIGNVQEQIRKL